MSEWALYGQTLVLRGNGVDVVPSADEVYSSVVEGTSP